MMLRHPTSHGNPGPGHVRREHGPEPPPLGVGAALAQVPRPRHHRVLRPGHPAQDGAVCKQWYGVNVLIQIFVSTYVSIPDGEFLDAFAHHLRHP